MNIKVNGKTGGSPGMAVGLQMGGMLKSTQERMGRQQACNNKVSFFENQIAQLKEMKCDSLEEIKRKLEMLESYQDSIAAAKKEYNDQQMFRVLDEARERGEKIAEKAKEMAPKTAEERKKELAEEARGGDEEEKGALTESLEKITEAMEEAIAEQQEEELEKQQERAMTEEQEKAMKEEQQKVMEAQKEEVRESVSQAEFQEKNLSENSDESSLAGKRAHYSSYMSGWHIDKRF